MAVNFTLLATAASLVIDGANEVISIIRKNREGKNLREEMLNLDERMAQFEERQDELYAINEKQSIAIRELAEQNKKLIQAGRNTRFLAFLALVIATAALTIAFAG
mgnify:CR=1 FL=1